MSNFMCNIMRDEDYMRLALKEAAKGAGHVSPNPMVGAVIVKGGQIIGKGYHQRCGEAHAEVNALKNCTASPNGATAYVTLEPCCHFGKQPPCTQALLNAGIARVVVGCLDPNPLVAGQGSQILRSHGVEVIEGVLEAECKALNRVFFHYITHRRPYVTLKYAMTLDGKIAAYTGESKWITGEAARAQVQQLRAQNKAIMVGVGTVLADDPALTCRLPNLPTPLRVICDTGLRTPLNAQVVQTAAQVPTLIATCCADEQKQAPYLAAGCRIMQLPADADGHPDLPLLLQNLAAEGIDSLLLEGGAELAWSMLNAGLVQRVQAYIAPLLLAGRTAKGPLGGIGFANPNAGIHLLNPTIRQIGEDFLIEADVEEVLPCSPA